MEHQITHHSKPKFYAKIDLDKRIKLTHYVIEREMSIAKAARKLNIKLSTAKLIIRKYKLEGTYFEKIDQRRARLE